MSGAVAEVPAGPGERLLIVNGDDFGLTPGVSRGIVDAYRHGVLRSTSMLAVGPAFELAAALATSGDADGLGIGAHLALVGEDPPLLSAREVPTLVDRRGGFTSSWREFLPRAAAGRIDPADVERELDAQLERLASVGVPLTHVDSHQHLHLWPPVGRIVLRLARRRDIRALRVTRSRDAGPVGAAVRRLARRLDQAAAEAGLAHPDDFTGLDEAGRLARPALLEAVGRVDRSGGRSTEIGCHPGRADDPERRRYRWGYAWPDELAALCDPEVARAVSGAGLRLGSFADLTRARPAPADQAAAADRAAAEHAPADGAAAEHAPADGAAADQAAAGRAAAAEHAPADGAAAGRAAVDRAPAGRAAAGGAAPAGRPG